MSSIGESIVNITSMMNHDEDSLLRRVTTVESTGRSTEIPGILDIDLIALTKEQRLGFEVTIAILCVLSLCGNFSTLYVNSRRKMRPFFRACLISLALSDLLSTIFLTLTHFPQFTAEYVQVWRLGSFMCGFIPMITTAAILASSLTLVGIALDRYFAVMKAMITFWNPGVGFCILFAMGIWLVCLGIASPVCFIYRTMTMYISTQADFAYDEASVLIIKNWPSYAMPDLLEPNEPIRMCISDQKDVAMYYVIVFSIIFVPCIVAFVWLNSIIARKIWTRRHRPPQQDERMSKSTSKSERSQANLFDASKSNSSSNKRSMKNTAGYNSAREARHIRMFIVIVVLMAVFIILRLPAWIFTVMRTYGSYSKQHDWIIFFSFAILNMTSCALNPLFYTFLPETLQYIACCKRKFCSNKRQNDGETMATKTEMIDPCCICCCSCLWRPPWLRNCVCKCKKPVFNSPENNNSNKKSSSAELDEGVDCSEPSCEAEAVDHEARKFEICIVFSSTFVSNYCQPQPQIQESYSDE